MKEIILFVIVVIVLLTLLLLLMKPFTVPENREYVVSMFGKFLKSYKAGLNWRFRFFTKIDSAVFMGDQSVQLPLGRPETGGGLVNFKDEAASMDITFYFRIFDSRLATYSVENILKEVTDLGDDAIRSFLALFKIEEANELKNNFDLGWIAATERPVLGDNSPDVSLSHFYLTLRSWGVEPLYFVIGDTDMPEAIIEQIKRKQEATTNIKVAALEIQVAKNKAKKALIDAESSKKVEILRASGIAEGMDKISEAMANRIKELIDKNGMSESAARDYVVSIAKMTALGNSGHVFWTEGNSAVGQGAALGAGFNAANTQE